jgi:hypothetical protein
MDERLDDLVKQLAAEPADRSLDGFEARVNLGVSRRRALARATSMLAAVRTASIGLALATGVTAGGFTGARLIVAPRTSGAFSAAADLAPSTLLDGQ